MISPRIPTSLSDGVSAGQAVEAHCEAEHVIPQISGIITVQRGLWILFTIDSYHHNV